MEIVLLIALALNLVQVNKDAARCKKADMKAEGCSIYKKINLK